MGEPATSAAPAPGPPPLPTVRLALGAAVIVALTVLAVWWAAPSWAALRDAAARVLDLSPARVAALVALVMAYIGAEALRLAVVGRLLGAPVGAGAAIDASITGHFFAAVAPGAVLGEGAAGYTLVRHGVPRAVAVLTPTIKLVTSFAVAYGAAGVLMLAGLGPPAGAWLTAASVALAVWGFLSVALLVAIARRPEAATSRGRRLAAWAERTRGPRARRAAAAIARGVEAGAARLGHLGDRGLAGAAAILGAHVLYYVVYVAPLVVLCPAAPAGDVAARGLLLLCLLFLAPTPGGAGVGEASAIWFLGDLVPPADAVAVAVTFRFVTSHIHVALGAVWVPLAARRWRRRLS